MLYIRQSSSSDLSLLVLHKPSQAFTCSGSRNISPAKRRRLIHSPHLSNCSTDSQFGHRHVLAEEVADEEAPADLPFLGLVRKNTYINAFDWL